MNEPLLHHHALPAGMRVRLRMPRPADAQAVGALAERVGVALDAQAVLGFDPRERAVICAATADGEIHGLAAIHLHRGAEPDLVLVDDAGGEALRELLCDALLSRAAGSRSAVRRRTPLGVRALRGMARRARHPAA
jgi:hypothetical protein